MSFIILYLREVNLNSWRISAIHFREGLEQYKKENFRKAIDKLNKAIQQDPTIATAWQYKAKALYNIGKFEEAYPSIQKAHGLDPKSIDICIDYVDVLLKFGSYDQLMAFCEENQDLAPQGFKLQTIKVHEKFKQYDLALKLAEELSVEYPDDEYLSRLRFFLQHADANKSQYYTSILQTGLFSHVPFGEEIIYSSPVKISWEIEKEPSKLEKILDEFMDFLDCEYRSIVEILEIPLLAKELDNKIKGEIYTHILAVPTGIVVGLPTPLSIFKPQKHKGIEPKFLSWQMVDLKRNGNIIINEILNYELNLYDDEPEASFINRKEGFYDLICSKRFSYTNLCLDMIRNYVADEKFDKAQELSVKAFESNLNYTNFNLNQQLNETLRPVNEWFQNREKDKFVKTEKLILDYLSKMKDKAFTYKAILRRLTSSTEDLSLIDFLKENFKGILNKLVYNGSISTQFHAGTDFYFIPP